MDPFDAIFDVLLSWEGGASIVASDPGNWTGGACGKGVLRGTKYGVSAAAFPTLDIMSLSVEQASAIYRALYWTKAGCPPLPAQLALLVFDSAVNNGVNRAVRFLQAATGAVQDGLPGTGTLVAVNVALAQPDGLDEVCGEFQARRLQFMASLPTWPTFGLGWARRLCRLPYQAVRLPLQTSALKIAA